MHLRFRMCRNLCRRRDRRWCGSRRGLEFRGLHDREGRISGDAASAAGGRTRIRRSGGGSWPTRHGLCAVGSVCGEDCCVCEHAVARSRALDRRTGRRFPVNYFTAYLGYWQAGMSGGDLGTATFDDSGRQGRPASLFMRWREVWARRRCRSDICWASKCMDHRRRTKSWRA